MVNKKANKNYCRAYRQRKGDLHKANDASRKKKTEKERRKYLEPKKYEVLRKKEGDRVRKCRF